MPLPTDKLGYAEKVLALRYEILERLRDNHSLSASSLDGAAACLNLVTDADCLSNLKERLDSIGSDSDLQEALSDSLKRRGAWPTASLPTAEDSSPPEILRHILVADAPCELKKRLEQVLLLINEGCVLLTLIDKDEILRRAAEVACKLTSGEAATAVVLEGRDRSRVRVCGTEQYLESFPDKARDLLKPIETGESVVIEGACLLPQSDHMPPGDASAHSVVSVPLRSTGRPIGVLLVGYPRMGKIDAGDIGMLEAFSKQVSCALENLTLHEQVRDLGRLQERQRIAQDLHDTVIQLLFVIGMEAEKLGQRWAEGSKEKESVSRIRRMASRAASELRSAIAALTIHPAYGDTPLSELLRDTIEEWKRLSDIQVTLIEPSEYPEISSEASRAVYRIVREALTNVQKHANATAAMVSVATRSGRLILSVQDNGVGFPREMDLSDLGDMHFGIRSMRRLAKQSGGHLELLNCEDGGAAIRFVLPLS